MRLWGPLLIVTVLGLAQSASAQKAPRALSPLVKAIEDCRRIPDPTQRLACYDRTAPAFVDANKAGDVTVVDRGQLRQARRSLFGFSMPKLPFFAGDESAADTPDTLETTIKQVHDFQNGRFQVVLTEGNAIWETTEEKIGLRTPRVGQKISIRRGPLGSYFMRINNGRSVKARRVG